MKFGLHAYIATDNPVDGVSPANTAAQIEGLFGEKTGTQGTLC